MPPKFGQKLNILIKFTTHTHTYLKLGIAKLLTQKK